PPAATAPMTPSAPYFRSCAPPRRFGARSMATRLAQLLGGRDVDGERQVFQRSRQHHGVVALCTSDADVLVEHVVEDRLRITVEGVAPPAAAAVVVDDALAGIERHPVG